MIFKEVQKHIKVLQVSDKSDYLTFVANVESTLDLDINLGKTP